VKTENITINIIETARHYINLWHSKNLRWDFNFEDHLEKKLTVLEHLAVKCAYHNYCIWHLIEDYKHPDTDQVLFVYHGGLEQNKFRNNTIELMDQQFETIQKGTGKFNSETIGSLIDRIGIMHVKIAHLQDDSRLKMIENQLAILYWCAIELVEDMIKGDRQCAFLSRFKTSGYN
jgi:hypothetical protein